jgi:hypothetical protein
MAEVNIWEDDTRVGKIIFDEQPPFLSFARTAAGFNLGIPAQLFLKSAPHKEPQLCLNNLRLTFSLKYTPGTQLELGRLHHDSILTAHVSNKPSESSQHLQLLWSATIPALLAIESFREDKQPTIHVQFQAELCRSIIIEQWQDHGRTANQRFNVMTVPQYIGDETDITYPVEVWNDMTQKVLAESQDDPYLNLLPLAPLLRGRRK